MTIIKIGIPSIIPDNDMQYMLYINKVIQRVDPNVQVTIIKGMRTYAYNVSPSEPGFKDKLVTAITIAHELLRVPILYSKTMALSTAIHFELR